MESSEIFLRFSSRIADIISFKDATKLVVSLETKRLDKLEKSSMLKDDSGEAIVSSQNLAYRDVNSGELKFYRCVDFSVQDKKRQLLLHQNKQYCWLIAEAYEEFEDLLERLYARLGMDDYSAWTLADFGNITINDVKLKDFEWFCCRAEGKKGEPGSIMDRLSALSSSVLEIETKNIFNVNMRLALILIANLRHIIVHKGVSSQAVKNL